MTPSTPTGCGSTPTPRRRESADYVGIMRLFAGTLLAEWSAHDLVERGIDLPAETVDQRLRYLEANGNLLVSPREVRVTSIAEYQRQPARFTATTLGVRVHRQIEEVLAAAGGAREVPRELLAAVAHRLVQLAALGSDGLAGADAGELLETTSTVFLQYETFAAAVTDFYTYVGSVLARADLDDDEWLGFKHLLLDYLETIVEAISRHTATIRCGPRPARNPICPSAARPPRPGRRRRRAAARRQPGRRRRRAREGTGARRLGRHAGVVRRDRRADVRRPAGPRGRVPRRRRAAGQRQADERGIQPGDLAAPPLPPPRRLVRRGDARGRPRARHLGVRPLRRPPPRGHARPRRSPRRCRRPRAGGGHRRPPCRSASASVAIATRVAGWCGSATTGVRSNASSPTGERDAEQRDQAIAELAAVGDRLADVRLSAPRCCSCSSCSVERRPASDPIWPDRRRRSSTPS